MKQTILSSVVAYMGQDIDVALHKFFYNTIRETKNKIKVLKGLSFRIDDVFIPEKHLILNHINKTSISNKQKKELIKELVKWV